MKENSVMPIKFLQQNRQQITFLIAVGCLMFAFELANFNLTIDEELAIRKLGANQTFIEQGRWAAYLLSATLLPSPIVPFVPLLISLVFSSLAFVLISHALGLTDRTAWYAAAPMFVGCPTLFYGYQFNTYNFTLGAGFFFAALGLCYFLKETIWTRAISIICLGAAIGIYESFLIFSILLFFSYLIVQALTNDNFQPGSLVKQSVAFIGCMILAVIFYRASQEFFYWIYGLSNNNYTSGYFNPGDSLTNWQQTLSRTGLAIKNHLSGAREIYGIRIPTLAYLLLLSVALIAVKIVRTSLTTCLKLLSVSIVVLLLFMPFAVNLVNFGTMPTRSLVSIPLVFAVLIYLGIAVSHRLVRQVLLVLAVLTTLNFALANSNLALRDKLALEADRALALRIQIRVDDLDTGEMRPIPLAIFGKPTPKILGNMGRLQTVGSSFFTHGGGNIHRIIFFMETLGMEDYRAATPDEKKLLEDQIVGLDSWPSKDSVALVNGVVVVKF